MPLPLRLGGLGPRALLNIDDPVRAEVGACSPLQCNGNVKTLARPSSRYLIQSSEYHVIRVSDFLHCRARLHKRFSLDRTRYQFWMKEQVGGIERSKIELRLHCQFRERYLIQSKRVEVQCLEVVEEIVLGQYESCATQLLVTAHVSDHLPECTRDQGVAIGNIVVPKNRAALYR